jgi:hypothetical protein
LVLPVTAVLVVDRILGLTPWLTLGALIICIPLSSVLVSRAALADMNRLIAVVAPPEDATPAAGPDTGPDSAPAAMPESEPSTNVP